MPSLPPTPKKNHPNTVQTLSGVQGWVLSGFWIKQEFVMLSCIIISESLTFFSGKDCSF